MSEELTIDKINESGNSFDRLQKFMLDELKPAIEELEHVHTPGLYGRLWKAKGGTMWVTRIHKVKHQFVILKGKVSVWVDGEEIEYNAPYHGITEAGTRRILYLHTDTEWMTFHPNPNNLNEDEMVEIVTEKHDNKLFNKEDEDKLLEIRSHIEKKYLIT
jgi:quercetin dioxygenase-like cupin family protein